LLPDSCLCSLVDVVKPLLVLLSDNELVLTRLDADVGRRFGGDCTIIAESSPTRALARLEEPPDQPDERVAVLIVDEQMEEMTGPGPPAPPAGETGADGRVRLPQDQASGERDDSR
jgi:hypothetical protein